MGANCGRDVREPHAPTASPPRPCALKCLAHATTGSTTCSDARTPSSPDVVEVEPATPASAQPQVHRRCHSDPPVRRGSRRRTTVIGNFIAHTPGDIEQVYDVGDKAGEGTQGVVFRARRRCTGVPRAIKKVPKTSARSDALKKEIGVMKRMDHPNVIKLYETFEDKTATYLVMELCTGGELFDQIVRQGGLREVEAAIAMQQILRAVQYVHEQDIAHRDLKPENFIFSTQAPISEDNVLKLIDFGLACDCGPGVVLREFVGTPFYLAPQVVTRRYDKSADVWSCGVIMFALLTGTVPFVGRNDFEILDKVREGLVRYNQPAWSKVSEGGRALVKRLLTRSVKERCTAEQALNHDWIKLHAPQATEQLQEGVVERLRDFRRQNRLKQAALAIVANGVSDAELQRLRKTFTALDTDCDGVLTLGEIKQGVLQAGLPMPADLAELFAGGDSGVLDYTEFLAATMDRRKHISDEACRMAFGLFDADGSGKITAEEIAKAFAPTGRQAIRAAKEESQSIVKRYSKRGDGTLDFEDFRHMMQNCGDHSPAAPSPQAVRKGSW